MGTKYYYYTLRIFNQENVAIPMYANGGIETKNKLPVVDIINKAADKFNTTIYNIVIVFAIRISKEDYRRVRVLSDSYLEYTRL